MNFDEVKSELKKICAEISNIEEKEIDDIKDVELQESFMRELLFNYCISQKYEIDGFPFAHLKRIENREPGYDADYLTWERMEYYIDKLALEKEDVFELRAITLENYYPDLSQKELKKEIEAFIELAEQDNINFDLTQEEIEEATREVKLYRPKLP